MFQHWQPFALFQNVAFCWKIRRNENKEWGKKKLKKRNKDMISSL